MDCHIGVCRHGDGRTATRSTRERCLQLPAAGDDGELEATVGSGHRRGIARPVEIAKRDVVARQRDDGVSNGIANDVEDLARYLAVQRQVERGVGSNGVRRLRIDVVGSITVGLGCVVIDVHGVAARGHLHAVSTIRPGAAAGVHGSR